MPPERRERVLRRLEAAWSELQESYAGLPDERLLEPGVHGDWSVKDVMAHVSTWEEEALEQLPVIARGGRPPRYAASGGIDAFNARMHERKRGLPLAEVRRLLAGSHRRLVELVAGAPEEQLVGESRYLRRLRLDTYGHYRLHAGAIRQWRAAAAAPGEGEQVFWPPAT
jgi:Mycothiol maleylpyruvate isomerase N-terminal domain